MVLTNDHSHLLISIYMYNISLNQFVINMMLSYVEISQNASQYPIQTFPNRQGNTANIYHRKQQFRWLTS